MNSLRKSILSLGFAFAGLAAVCAQGTLSDGSKWHWNKGTI